MIRCIASWAVWAAVTGCYVHHGAYVTPGLQVDVAGGVAAPTYQPSWDETSGNGFDAQLSVRYGKRFDRDFALLGSLMLPLSAFDAFDGTERFVPVPGADIYLQVLGTGIDGGIGAALPFGPYVQVGKSFARSKGTNIELSAGAQYFLGSSTSLKPFALASLSWSNFRVGAWIDVRRYPVAAFDGCEDCLEDDAAREIRVFGLLFGWTARAARDRWEEDPVTPGSTSTASRRAAPQSVAKEVCARDSDCAPLMRCSSERRCSCQIDDDCAATQACRAGLCRYR